MLSLESRTGYESDGRVLEGVQFYQRMLRSRSVNDIIIKYVKEGHMTVNFKRFCSLTLSQGANGTVCW